MCFEKKVDAERYLKELPGRLAKFKLELAVEKSALAKFNRWEPEDSGKFTFLGFDFFWKKTRRNPLHRKVTRKTNPKKFRNSLKSMKEWLKKARSLPLPDIIATLKRKLIVRWSGFIGPKTGRAKLCC